MTITPETVERNRDGMWSHSAWDALFGDRENITCDELDTWSESHNLIVECHTLEDEPESRFSAQLEASEPIDLNEWPLQPPSDADGWFLLAIVDTEDGPCQTWARLF
ncbi:hypothetical protein ACUN9V_18790 [Salinicola sp. V024]|uniref:hypothetical protein n=1 Tax=Salinicola sp. V024 TaxID=3459609 RepID=UPI0040444CD0